MKTTQSFRIAQIISLYSFLCVGVFTSLASAVEFAGGTGEPNDPYQIATAEQLIGISSDPNLFDKHFVLTADIDLDPSLPGRTIFRQAVVEWSTVPVMRSIRHSDHLGSRLFRQSLVSRLLRRRRARHPQLHACQVTATRGTSGFFGEIAPAGRRSQPAYRGHDGCRPRRRLPRYSVAYPGLLAAVNRGTVLGCSATGTLTTYTAGGGLIGQNIGLVIGCRASCDHLRQLPSED